VGERGDNFTHTPFSDSHHFWRVRSSGGHNQPSQLLSLPNAEKLSVQLSQTKAEAKAIGSKAKAIKFGLEAPRGQGLALRTTPLAIVCLETLD